MRGQATQAGATATEQSIKAKFGSVRMQRRQDQFAKFVSNALRLKAEIIARHFEPQVILDRCNCQYTPDAEQMDPKTGQPLPVAAVQMIKSNAWMFRLEVKPEAIALTDFAALKDERTEVVGATAQFWAGITPLIQQLGPTSLPVFLEVYQWMLAGLRGAKQIEGVIDQYITKAKEMAANPQPQQPPPPDPKLLAQQMKGQQDMAKTQADLQAYAVKSQIDIQTEMAKQRAQTDENTRELVLRHRIDNAMKPPEMAPLLGGLGGLGGPKR
jgi:hypothetical protein